MAVFVFCLFRQSDLERGCDVKITLRLIMSLLIGTALVVLIFSYLQTRNEEVRLNEELGLRASVLAKTFTEAIEPFLEQTESPGRIRKFIEKFTGHKRLVGIIVYLKDTGLITIPTELGQRDLFRAECENTAENSKPTEVNRKWDGRDVNFYAMPITKADQVVGALGLIHDRTFIVRRIQEAWKSSAVTFSILAFILSATTLVIIRWSVTGPIAKIAEAIKKTASGEELPSLNVSSEPEDIDKLASAVIRMASHLKSVRKTLAEQSRAMNAHGAVWDRDRLRDYLKSKLGGRSLFVVANREPYMHRRRENGKEFECITPASGLVTALDPVLQATGGVWVAHGSGDADRDTSDSHGKIAVPPSKPTYFLKRVWLTAEEERGYYYGFSNEGFWPLCHISHMRPVFRVTDWHEYYKVNQKFAEALLSELPDESPLILVQDYHFALLPAMIKEARPDAKVALFWHIPWPNPEAFGICPWQKEILDGMLGSDLIGFHTQYHCNNFLDTVDRFLESRIDWSTFSVTRNSKTCSVRPFPISVSGASGFEESESVRKKVAALKRSYGLTDKWIGIGVDRIDYTKGLLERFRAIERTLEKYPHCVQKFVFVELGAPSRTLIEGYQSHLKEVEALSERVNTRFQKGNWKPILFLKDHHRQDVIREFYRAADFCLVSSLHDGMNLVAKEFVMEREDESGVLILSRFAGASQELSSALLINPYDIEGTADAIHQALNMVPEERKERMARMRTVIREHNVYRWAAEIVAELVKSF